MNFVYNRFFSERIFYNVLGGLVSIIIFGWFFFQWTEKGQSSTSDPINKPCIAIVIDDFGYGNDHIVDGFLSLEVPMSYAVIPGHNYSSDFAREAHSKGFEILIHMPMESHEKPEREEPLIITSSMNNFEIENAILAAFHEIPEAVGMNNHQGSKATELDWMMNIVGRILKRKNMYFLDSRTSAHTKAEETIKKNQVQTGHRNIFLDNKEEWTYIENQLKKIAALAKAQGFAIGIGHAKELTLEVLEKKIPELLKNGYHFCLVSEVLDK